MQKTPLKTKLIVGLLKALSFPPIPQKPKTGKWYRIDLPGCIRADGPSLHAGLRIGSENKLMVVFHGGGISWNEYMAARGYGVTIPDDGDDKFYAVDGDLLADIVPGRGLTSKKEDCYFKDWSILSIAYCSGDFHCGTGDFPYTAKDGSEKILHHHGYTNYRAALEAALPYVGREPDQIMVTGFSAGGFGTALLTDDVMRSFPSCQNVICYVDSGFMLYDGWHTAAREVWKAPQEICDRLVSNNITLDCLTALKKDHGDRVKLLFSCSVRDVALSGYWSFVKNGRLYTDRSVGIQFQRDLKEMCQKLLTVDPAAGIYLFDTLTSEPKQEKERADGLTQHCIGLGSSAEKIKIDGITVAEWAAQAAQGKVSRIGMHLLDL